MPITRLALAALACVALLGACGGEDQAATAPQDENRRQQPQADPLALPGNVPLRASGDADAGARRVIKAWSDALRSGDVERASALWAVPSTVQNGTPVLKLTSAADVLAFNSSLACGSVLTSAGAAEGGFTIAVVRLTERPGGDCGTGTGNTARVAIRVADDKIGEWYRLPDDPDAPASPAAPPAGPII